MHRFYAMHVARDLFGGWALLRGPVTAKLCEMAK
jgi:hypothetical protein